MSGSSIIRAGSRPTASIQALADSAQSSSPPISSAGCSMSDGTRGMYNGLWRDKQGRAEPRAHFGCVSSCAHVHSTQPFSLSGSGVGEGFGVSEGCGVREGCGIFVGFGVRVGVAVRVGAGVAVRVGVRVGVRVSERIAI